MLNKHGPWSALSFEVILNMRNSIHRIKHPFEHGKIFFSYMQSLSLFFPYLKPTQNKRRNIPYLHIITISGSELDNFIAVNTKLDPNTNIKFEITRKPTGTVPIDSVKFWPIQTRWNNSRWHVTRSHPPQKNSKHLSLICRHTQKLLW